MMLEKFLEAERIEQMNATKRRRKLLEHRREVQPQRFIVYISD
jgi:hypothetical protein